MLILENELSNVLHTDKNKSIPRQRLFSVPGPFVTSSAKVLGVIMYFHGRGEQWKGCHWLSIRALHRGGTQTWRGMGG